MDVFVRFLGGAQSVTGSKYLLEIDKRKILIDCGLFQGQKELRLRNWYPLPVDPSEIDVVVITHAHVDHTGYLPRLVKDGFKGRIICTQATEDLMEIMLMDAAKLQMEESEFAAKRGYSKHSNPEPLFDTEDARQVLKQVSSYQFHQDIPLYPHINIIYHLAGHILGAAWVEMILTGETQTKRIVFSGDLGRQEDPIMFAPEQPAEADILFIESTYGDRLNPMKDVENQLITIIKEVYDNKGVLVIPAFAVGRTQILLYYLNALISAGKIPKMNIYIDSPMAISVTDLYERHDAIHKIKVSHEHGKLISIFDSPYMHFCNTRESSKALNSIYEPMIIVSASGMATGGRVLHHLVHRLSNVKNTVMFAGYQAEGSRGRKIMDGEKIIRMLGKDVPVLCHVRELQGLSAHADQSELLLWIKSIQHPPKITFITHGEKESALTFSKAIESQLGWKTFIPHYLEFLELFKGI